MMAWWCLCLMHHLSTLFEKNQLIIIRFPGCNLKATFYELKLACCRKFPSSSSSSIFLLIRKIKLQCTLNIVVTTLFHFHVIRFKNKRVPPKTEGTRPIVTLS